MTIDWRERLLALRAELEAVSEAGEASSAVVELDQSKVGRLSRMDAMQAQAMAAASNQRRAVMLKKISAALGRLDAGSFGLCQDCEETINPKRLAFDPTSTLCIDCASKAERD